MSDTDRCGYAEQAEVWQARASQAEARVAELEAALRRIVETSMSEDCDTFEVADRMQEIAEEALAALPEAEAEAERRDRSALMRVLAAQTGETMRLRGACENAAAMLREDRAKAALALLEEAIRV